jgi:hypothetical protein
MTHFLVLGMKKLMDSKNSTGGEKKQLLQHEFKI